MDEFCVTTCLSSGTLDVDAINELKIKNINVSLDTLDPQKYRWLTRVGDLESVKRNLNKLRISKVHS